MEFDNSFEVPLPPAQTWALLMDIPRIAPCMPGAELTEIVDAQNYKGKIAVRLGPVALAFKGRGGSDATATFRIEPSGDGAKVLIHTELMLSGAVAQYGRGVGMIQATAAQIIGQFANNLRRHFAGQPDGAPASDTALPPAAKPISGLSVVAKAL